MKISDFKWIKPWKNNIFLFKVRDYLKFKVCIYAYFTSWIFEMNFNDSCGNDLEC